MCILWSKNIIVVVTVLIVWGLYTVKTEIVYLLAQKIFAFSLYPNWWPLGVEVKKEWRYASTTVYTLMPWCLLITTERRGRAADTPAS
jgi:hypothetical protein